MHTVEEYNDLSFVQNSINKIEHVSLVINGAILSSTLPFGIFVKTLWFVVNWQPSKFILQDSDKLRAKKKTTLQIAYVTKLVKISDRALC